MMSKPLHDIPTKHLYMLIKTKIISSSLSTITCTHFKNVQYYKSLSVKFFVKVTIDPTLTYFFVFVLREAKKAKKQKEEPKKQHELKFTLLSLANLKKSKAPASQVIHQESEQSPTPDSSPERHDEVKQETRADDVFNIEDATSAFVPLRLIPDPARSGMLLSDTIHINPDAMSVQVIGLGRKQKIRFKAKVKEQRHKS
ncbi:uncharacterized protein CDAR_106341 [Caerostris darwini]|uniref:Uncharacterized protein n=1 Tax=Caerostris darwini TaxID=1538125 RepID=A0AAV4SIY2_9ARAC|nr:uncharacterized protein CDAR_106341 [Caerostris darwini]